MLSIVERVARIVSRYVINRAGHMWRFPLSHAQLCDESERVRKGYAAKLVEARQTGDLDDVPDPTGLFGDAALMADVKHLAETGEITAALRKHLEVTLGSIPITTANDERNVKVMRSLDGAVIQHGGLGAALRARASVYDVGNELGPFMRDARVLERARKQLEKERRAAARVFAATTAADATDDAPRDLAEAIVADEEVRAAMAEALVLDRTGRTVARDARAAARAAAVGAPVPAATALPAAGVARAAPPPPVVPAAPVYTSKYLAFVTRKVAEALRDLYMNCDDADRLSFIDFVDRFYRSALSSSLERIVADRPDAPLERLRDELRRRAGDDAPHLEAFAALLGADDHANPPSCPLCMKNYANDANARRHLLNHIESTHLLRPLSEFVRRVDNAYDADEVRRCMGLVPGERYRGDGPRLTDLGPNEVFGLFQVALTDDGAMGLLRDVVHAVAASVSVQLSFEADRETADAERARAAETRHGVLAASRDTTDAAQGLAQLTRQLGSTLLEEPPSPAPSIEAEAPPQPPPPPRS